MTSYEFFQLAERVEDLSRHLYLALAEDPSTPPRLRELFLGLADEEAEHGRRIQLLSASLRSSSWKDQIVKHAEAGMRAAASEYQAFLTEATTRRRPGDLIRILDRLVEMEDRLGFVHAEELAQGAEPGVARLFQALAKQDRRHQKLLERARRDQGLAAACG